MSVRNNTQRPKRDRYIRYFPRKESEGQQSRTVYKQQNKEFIPAPPTLKKAIQLMYRLIRLTHHMSRVTTKIEGNQPITFKRLTGLLMNTIRPAFPNDRVTQMIRGSAQNWSYTTQLILEQHYEDQIENTMREIREETERADWAQAFEIATGWADKNYGVQIDADTIERAEALITAELCEIEKSTLPQSSTNEATTSGARTYAQAAASPPIQYRGPSTLIPPQISARPKAKVQHVEIQTSPGLLTLGTSINRPQSRGDWSFDDEGEDDNPLDPKEILRPIQVASPLPKAQRVGRLKKVQIILPEETPAQHEQTPSHAANDGGPSKRTELLEQLDFSEEEGENNNEEDSPRNRPFTQAEFRGSDHSSPLSIILFPDSEEEPAKVLSPLTKFLYEAYEVPIPEQRPTQADTGVINTENTTAGPIQAENGVTGTEKTVPRPTQALPEIIPLSEHTVTNGALTIQEKDREIPLEKEPARGKHTSKKKHIEISEAPPVAILPQHNPVSEEQPHSTQPAAQDSSATRPMRHTNTSNKLLDWSLTLTKKLVIIGDSNVARLPQHNYSELQIDSFPGAKWQHAANLLEKATVVVEPHKIILSFGFNNRQQRYRITALTELRKARNVAAARLPKTEVLIPLINFAPTLPLYEQVMIEHLNSHIRKSAGYIPALPAEQFRVDRDGVHWTALTARAIFDHWRSHLNY